MPRDSGRARVVLTAEEKAFVRGVRRSETALKSMGRENDRLRRQVDRLSGREGRGGLGGLVANFKSFLAVAAAPGALLGIARGFATFSNAVADAATTLRAQSASLGLTIEQFGILNRTFLEGGATQQQATTGLRTFSTAVAEAARGTLTYRRAFEELGVEIRGGNGALRSHEDLLREIARRLDTVDRATRTDILARLFGGRSGAAFASVLSQGAEGFDALTEAAREQGVVSDFVVAQNERLSTAINTVNTDVERLRLEFGAVVAPDLIRAWTAWGEIADGIAAGFTDAYVAISGARAAIDRDVAAGIAGAQTNAERVAALSEGIARARAEEARAAGTLAALQADAARSQLVNNELAQRAAEQARDAAAEQIARLAEERRRLREVFAVPDAAAADPGPAARRADLLERQSASLERQLQFLRPLGEIERERGASAQAVLDHMLAQGAAAAELSVRLGLAAQRQRDLLGDAAQAGGALRERFRFLPPPEETSAEIARQTAEIERGLRGLEYDPGGAFAETFGRAEESLRRQDGLARQVGQNLLTGINASIAASNTLGGALRGIAASLASTLLNFGLNALIPGRQFGGPVSRGRPYLVGERGPEIVVPRSAGQVLPNEALGGVTVNFAPVVNATDAGVAELIDSRMANVWAPQIQSLVEQARARGLRRPGSRRA